jgi:hypothetical protein
MVLTARKGLRSGGLGRIPTECDLGLRFWQRSGSDERPRRTLLHCAVGIFGSRAPLSDELQEWIFDLHQPSKPIVRYHHSAGWRAEERL